MRVKRRASYFITRIKQVSSRIFSQKLEEHQIEISPGQGRLLFLIWENPHISVNKLAHKAALSKSTVSTLLKKLKSQHYIQIEHPPGTNRKKVITYQKRDLDLERVYSQISDEMNQILYSGLEESEIELFEATLERVFANLATFEERMKEGCPTHERHN